MLHWRLLQAHNLTKASGLYYVPISPAATGWTVSMETETGERDKNSVYYWLKDKSPISQRRSFIQFVDGLIFKAIDLRFDQDECARYP